MKFRSSRVASCLILANIVGCHANVPLPQGSSLPASRALEASTSSGSASKASSSDFGTYWRSSGVPASVTYDLTPLKQRGATRVLVLWYNDATYSFDHSLIGQPGYNNLGSYVIEGQNASGTWTPLATVSGNTRHSREHVVDIGGLSSLRLRVEKSDGSPGNADAGAHIDIYDISGGFNDGWLFVGDSITANGMGHAPIDGEQGFAAELERAVGIAPPQENAGIPGWTTSDVANVLGRWLDEFPGRYVPLAFGTNDAAASVAPGEFADRLEQLTRQIIAKGKVPIIPTIPWSREPGHAARIPDLNRQIDQLAAKSGGRILRGPDLYALFAAQPELISSDGVHPTDAGYAELRKAWVNWAVANVYSKGGKQTTTAPGNGQ